MIAVLKVFFQVLMDIFGRLFIEMHALEQLFLNMRCVYSFLCQALFFTMTEIVLFGEQPSYQKTNGENPQFVITGLSALLFYSIFGYFISKVRDAYTNGILEVRNTNDSNVQLYFKWIVRVIIEWAKAMAVIVCIRDRDIPYNLDIKYTLITMLYYMCTEKLFIDIFVTLISCFKLSMFDCMEHLYIPIILNVYTLVNGIVITTYMLHGKQAKYAIYSAYFIIYLRIKDIYYNYIKALMLEKNTFASFKSATEDDICKWDDICAVCLNKMSRAKITPCNHLFHPECLKHCLRTSLQCPLCKQDFLQ